MDTAQRLKTIMSRVFRVPERDITDSSSVGRLANWDSFNHVILVVAIEKEFGITLTPEEVVEAVSVARIKSILKKRV